VEGLPMVLLEAMAAGMPVVASRVGAIPEVVEHERDALLIAPGDVPGLASALRRLLTDQALCQRLAASAGAIIQKDYAASRIVAELEGLYQSLSTGAPIGSRPRPA
jgi:glycosyltransferase involved in cell wall biosynthesis